jgi:hypothetical protein
MNIPLHVPVYCTDGVFGHTTNIIINPINQEPTHVVVNNRRVLGDEHTVPVSLIALIIPDRVFVYCDRYTVANLPKLQETAFDRLGIDPELRETHLYWPFFLPEDASLYAAYQTASHRHEVSPESLEVCRGMRVFALDTEIGSIWGFIAHPITSAVGFLIIGHEHLWRHPEFTVPIGTIERIEAGNVILNLSATTIKQLPMLRFLSPVPALHA